MKAREMIVRGKMGGALVRFCYQVTVTAGEATTPKFTFAAGAPIAKVDWGDGTAQSTVTSGTEMNHAYAGSGTFTVTLLMPNQEKWVTRIEINADKVVGSLWAAAVPRLKALTQFNGSSNAGMTGGFSLANLPSGMTSLSLWGTASSITGSLANLPSSMTYLSLGATTSSITGSLANLPSSMTYLSLGATTSSITGGGTAMAAQGIQSLYLHSMTMTQAQVDDVISRLWTDKATFTYATPLMQIGGTNPAPTGVYQNASPPATGKEKIYDLINGSYTPAGPEWTITYTA